MWLAFLGAFIAAVIVYFLGSIGRDGLTPIKIVLAGSAISALFMSLTQAILVLNEVGMQNVLFWLAGSVSGRTLEMLQLYGRSLFWQGLFPCPWEKHQSLDYGGRHCQRTRAKKTVLVKSMMGILIVVLAGSSVAIVGAIGFIGLVIPHIARALVGNDYRWVIPFSALLGAILLLSADVVARLVILPQEVPIGVITAFIGVPFFVYIARKGVAWK